MCKETFRSQVWGLNKQTVKAKRSSGDLGDRGPKSSGQHECGAKQARRGEVEVRDQGRGEADGIDFASTTQTRINKRKMFANSTVLARLLKAGRVNQEDVARTLEGGHSSQAATCCSQSVSADVDQRT